MTLRLLKLLRQLPRGARYAWLVVEARDRSARGRYEAAMERLRTAYAVLGETPPSPRVPPATNMLAAHVAGRLHDVPLTLSAARMAIRQLAAGRGRYRAADRTYLTYWCHTSLRYCAQIAPLDAKGIREEAALTFEDLRLDQVAPRLRRNFPIYTPEDPDFLL